MKKLILPLLLLSFSANLSAFELSSVRASGLPAAAELPQVPSPERLPAPRAAAAFAVYKVGNIGVVVPSIGCGNNLMAAIPPRETSMAEVALRNAFAAPSAAKLVPLTPKSSAELEFAAQNPGATIYSLNQFLPANVTQLFNREPNFGGPNCFNAAFTAAGMMRPDQLRHVGNDEADQLLSMYYKKVPSSDLRPGDILVINDGDHGVYYLGAGLVFHKKSFLKNHIYRIVPLEKVYEAEPYEWTPSPFDGGSYQTGGTISRKDAWRPTGAQYQFGPATAAEQARVNAIIFLEDNIVYQAPRWAFAKQNGYFTERLLENLVSDWAAMEKSPNPVLKAYYYKLASLRDQANQSIEVELLSSQHAQANANEVLKAAWFPRNDYSRGLVGQLLAIYGRPAADTDAAMAAIEKDYDGAPLKHIKGN